MPNQRRGPGAESRAATSISTVDTSKFTSSDGFDFDQRVVAQVDKGLWEALMDGHFKLAVRCDVCSRWVTSDRSKRNHRGPRCAAKVGESE